MKIATFVRQIFPMMYFEVYDDDDVKEREVFSICRSRKGLLKYYDIP
jgi:hypothetical protein